MRNKRNKRINQAFFAYYAYFAPRGGQRTRKPSATESANSSKTYAIDANGLLPVPDPHVGPKPDRRKNLIRGHTAQRWLKLSAVVKEIVGTHPRPKTDGLIGHSL
jgi:hypothetical protein